MAGKCRKVSAIVVILVIVALLSFLLYWFLGRQFVRDITYKLVEFDVKKEKSISEAGDKLPEDQCGPTPEVLFDYKKTGDFVAPPASFGWTAYFDYSMKEGSTSDITGCGGSIINERYILTAAHCVYAPENQNLKIAKIRLGLVSSTNSTNCLYGIHCDEAEKSIGIEQIIPHPDYAPKSTLFYNDIALIRVDEDIKFNQYISSVCLAERTVVDDAESKHLFGWGKNMTDNRLVPEKHVVVLTYTNHEKCKEFFPEYDEKMQICATSNNTKEFCMRDSGNAVARFFFNQWFAEAIDSFGKRCVDKAGASMGVYTRIAHFKDWIISKLRK